MITLSTFPIGMAKSGRIFEIMFNVFELVGENRVRQALEECRQCCMIEKIKVCTEGHHIVPDSKDGDGDWTNAIYLSATNHDRIHCGEFNEMILPCVETWVLRHLGIEFKTELKEIDCTTDRGVGAGCRMHLFIEVPTKEFHTPRIILTERKKNKSEVKVMPWTAKNKLARKVRIE